MITYSVSLSNQRGIKCQINTALETKRSYFFKSFSLYYTCNYFGDHELASYDYVTQLSLNLIQGSSSN